MRFLIRHICFLTPTVPNCLQDNRAHRSTVMSCDTFRQPVANVRGNEGVLLQTRAMAGIVRGFRPLRIGVLLHLANGFLGADLPFFEAWLDMRGADAP
jgi:hypothetical protein